MLLKLNNKVFTVFVKRDAFKWEYNVHAEI